MIEATTSLSVLHGARGSGGWIGHDRFDDAHAVRAVRFRPATSASFSAEASTDIAMPTRRDAETTDTMLTRVWSLGREEDFQDGVTSRFSRELETTVRDRGVDCVLAIHAAMISGRVPPGLLAEAFRWIGSMEEPATQSARRWLLEEALGDKDLRIRDGAVLGLQALGDPLSRRSLAEALARERVDLLRRSMGALLLELE